MITDTVFEIIGWAIIIRAILSWFPNAQRSPIVRTLNEFTEPLLRPFRRFQFSGGSVGIDLSPLLAYLVIILIRTMVLPIIFNIIATVIK